MKRRGITLINIVIMGLILAFVVIYSTYENNDTYWNQVRNFENTTGPMRRSAAPDGRYRTD